MKYILGISSFYHDSAAALIDENGIIAAAQEERFTRKKFDPSFPLNAINYCLEEAFIDVEELSAIAYYDDPVLSFDRIFNSAQSTYPNSRIFWRQAVASFAKNKFKIAELIKDRLNIDVPIYFARHHASHAASAFYPSPYSEAAILTVDGVGEWDTTSLGYGSGDDINIIKSIEFPHSLGLLYSAFTYYTGFKVNSGEYKMMGLAPYGKPSYYSKIKDNIIDIKSDGSFTLNMEYFSYLNENHMIGESFQKLFGGPARNPNDRISWKDLNIAASIQLVIEEVLENLARHLADITNTDNLVMAGGVALNCVANGKLLKSEIFKNIWVQPAAGDAGGALGAAFLLFKELGIATSWAKNGRDMMNGALLGPQFTNNEVEVFLTNKGVNYELMTQYDDKISSIAQDIVDGKVVGLFSGRMEYGPRALGARSILGDPRNVETQVTMNLKIKYRESFRPFAPSVLVDNCSEYFNLDSESPYMLFVAETKPERCFSFSLPEEKSGEIDLLDIVRNVRSDIPAVTHVDYSARIQTVNYNDNPTYYDIIKKFKDLTGYGVIVNTSFNVRGEPIVCTPKEAYNCFINTEMDVLYLNDYKIIKSKLNEVDYDSLKKLLENDASSSIVSQKTDKKLNKQLDYMFDVILKQMVDSINLKEVQNRFFGNNSQESSFIENNNRVYIRVLDYSKIFNELKKNWSKCGYDPSQIEILIKKIKDLSNNFVCIDEDDELSPFVYAMF